jgi:hypothetical protein
VLQAMMRTGLTVLTFHEVADQRLVVGVPIGGLAPVAA